MINILFTYSPLKFLVQSFWRDESFSYIMAKQNILDLLQFTAKDFNPPLYYLALKLWMTIFGTSEIALRTLSLLFYFLTIYVAYLFLVKILHYSKRKSSLYLLLFITNPILVFYAFEARMYIMFAFFTLLSYFAFVRKQPRLYILATTLGLFTHYFMIFVLLTQFVIYVISKLQNKVYTLNLKKLVIPLLIFSPWILFLILQKKIIAESFWITSPKLIDIFLLPSTLYTGYEGGFESLEKNFLILVFSVLVGILIFLGFVQKKMKQSLHTPNYFLLFSLWAFLPSLIIFIFSFYKPLYLPRYLIFTSVGLLFLIVILLEKLQIKFRIIVFTLLVIFTFQYHIFQLSYKQKTNTGKVIKEIKSLANKNDLLYITNELDYFNGAYYFDENRVFIYGRQYEKIPTYVGKALIPKEKLTNQLPLYPKKAFILKDELHYDIQAMY